MASEKCDHKNSMGDECGDPAPFYYPENGFPVWRCQYHGPSVPPGVLKPGDPIPGMTEPRAVASPAGAFQTPPTSKPGGFSDEAEEDRITAERLARDTRVAEQLDPEWQKEMQETYGEEHLATSPGGVKFDSEKVRFDLISVPALEGLARVLTYGASKYEAHNWRKGIEWHRLIRATLAHFTSFMRGEDMDPESGLPHIDHVMCNVMFLSEFAKTGNGTDDRYEVGL